MSGRTLAGAGSPRVEFGVVRTVPPITRTRVTDEDIRARVDAWKAAHPGFDEGNYPDAFRDDAGELIEDDEFFAAVDLFALFSTLSK